MIVQIVGIIIQDIGQVIEDEVPQGISGQAKVVKLEIITVVNTDQHKSCPNRFAKCPTLRFTFSNLSKMQCQNEISQMSKP